MTTITEISDHYVADLLRLSPAFATYCGLPGDHHRLDDMSPAGLAEFNDLAVRTIAAAKEVELQGESDEIAQAVLIERLQVDVDMYEAGLRHADLNVLASPLQQVRMLFDVMPTETDDDWSIIAARMAAVPSAMAGYAESLRFGAARGQTPALRQVQKCAAQCDVYSGGSGPGFFSAMAASADRDGDLALALSSGAELADAAFADFGAFLRTELATTAPAKDAVGAKVYALTSRAFTGADLDLAETYHWGWQEFLAIEAELLAVAHRINPNATAAQVAAQLDSDPAHQVQGQDGLQAWMQQLADTAVAELGRTHFDIPEKMRTIECLIAPPGGGVGAYYTHPNDDFSRPGRMWWAVEPGRETFSTWRETTVVYHEGVPGHHLQLGLQVYRRDTLNDFQRLIASTSGHAEGWALYAERLVRELGYLSDDGNLLGMLSDQLFRAARVVLDIGMHLELEIPAGTGFHEGETWTPELGLEFLLTRTIADPAHSRDEIDRYLGWPGQAPCYKVGERVWLEARDAARERHGDDFNLKAFHMAALNMGGMGLDPLRDLLAKL